MCANVTVTGGMRLIKPMMDPSQLEKVLFSSSEANNIFIGDAVQLTSAIGGGAIGSQSNVQQVAKSAASGAIYGIVQGFLPQYVSGNGSLSFNQLYRPASTAMYAMIRRATNQDVYSIMDDGTLASGARSSLGVTNVGLNANLNVSTAGNTSNGQSNMQLTGSTAATTATLQLKIIGVDPTPGNDPTAVNARWLVTINNATFSGGTGTAGE